jgi:hypothetical protein
MVTSACLKIFIRPPVIDELKFLNKSIESLVLFDFDLLGLVNWASLALHQKRPLAQQKCKREGR